MRVAVSISRLTFLGAKQMSEDKMDVSAAIMIVVCSVVLAAILLLGYKGYNAIVGRERQTVQKIESRPQAESRRDHSNIAYSVRARSELKGRLRDPRSMEVIGERVTRNSNGATVTITYRARNGFGGYNVEVAELNINDRELRHLDGGTSELFVMIFLVSLVGLLIFLGTMLHKENRQTYKKFLVDQFSSCRNDFNKWRETILQAPSTRD
jgi:hypothetical protein